MSQQKARLLFVFRGPKWDLDDCFAQRLALLSRDFEGDLLTTGSRNETRYFGAFRVTSLDHHVRPGVQMAWAALRYAVAKRLRREHVDLVVTTDPLAMGLLGVLTARVLRARLVVELNGDYADAALYADSATGKVAWRRRQRFLSVIRYVLARADGIKTLHPRQLEPYQTDERRPVIGCFHNFVDLSRFRNMGEDKTVLLAGFPFRVKGVDLLIEAFKRVAPRHPDWRLVILGWYPDPALPERHIDGHPRIELRKPVHHRDMPEQVGRAGICVLASRSEGMGRFLLEAMHAGKPRIGARVGGIPTIVNDEVDGLLFTPEDVEGLAGCLDRLMGDPGLRHRLGAAAQARASELGAETYYARLRRFYRDVMGFVDPADGEQPVQRPVGSTGSNARR